MHLTGSLLSFMGFACMLYAAIGFLRNSKDKKLKAAIYSGIIGTIFLIAGIGLVLSSPEEETIFVPYGSIKKLEQLYFYLHQYYSPQLYLV
jgi:multisubunit Na+/H+ antiporter MnhG subunit